MYKYEKLSGEIATQISRRTLRPGERLPSLRQLADRHAISMNTATRVYEQLEAQGLIASEEKRGFFVKDQTLLPSPNLQQKKAVLITRDRTNVLMDIQRSSARKDLVNLAAGMVAGDYLPLAELERSVRRSSRRQGRSYSTYGDPAGEASLRQAIAEVMQRRLGRLPLVDNLMVTNGCMEAVSLCVQDCTRPGDVVAIFTPCYNGLLMMLQNLGRQVLEIPCASDGPDLDYLESLLQKKRFQCLVFSAIGFNPLGFSLGTHDKERLARLAQHYQIPFIEDDTFGELAYAGVENTPVFAYDHSGMVRYCSSFSKSLCPGWRIGWLASNNGTDALIKKKMAVNLSCNQVTQHALADYLFSGNWTAHVQRLRWNLERNTLAMHQWVADYFPSGIAVKRPSGGFFLWIQLPPGTAAMDVYQQAAEHKILIAPGDIFSMADLHTDKLRLSCAQATDARIEKAIKKLGKLVAQLH